MSICKLLHNTNTHNTHPRWRTIETETEDNCVYNFNSNLFIHVLCVFHIPFGIVVTQLSISSHAENERQAVMRHGFSKRRVSTADATFKTFSQEIHERRKTWFQTTKDEFERHETDESNRKSEIAEGWIRRSEWQWISHWNWFNLGLFFSLYADWITLPVLWFLMCYRFDSFLYRKCCSIHKTRVSQCHKIRMKRQ